jgi:hypothetical protein
MRDRAQLDTYISTNIINMGIVASLRHLLEACRSADINVKLRRCFLLELVLRLSNGDMGRREIVVSTRLGLALNPGLPGNSADRYNFNTFRASEAALSGLLLA